MSKGSAVISKWKECRNAFVLITAFASPFVFGLCLVEYDYRHRPTTDWENLPPLPRNYGEKVEYISGHEYLVKGSLIAPQYIHSPECLKCWAGRRR